MSAFRCRRVLHAWFFAALLAAPQVTGQDEITVQGSPSLPGALLEIPLFVRDASGTPLGSDSGVGNRIQGFAISLTYSPAASVATSDFARAGVTLGVPAVFETVVRSTGRITWIASFDESQHPIAFTLDGLAPGDQAGTFRLRIDATAPEGEIQLGLDGATTTLSNQAGTVDETVANGFLALFETVVTVSSCSSPDELALASLTIDFALVCESGTALTVGPDLTIVPPAQVLLRAGHRVIFEDRVVVETDAELTVEIDPALRP